MIRSVTDKRAGSIRGNTVLAADGELGTTTDVLFDDHAWTVRYLVVYIGSGLDGPETLITPGAISEVEVQEKTLHVDASVERTRQAPYLQTNLPVAAQQEVAYYEYLGAEPYWDQPPGPLAPLPPQEAVPGEASLSEMGDPHLRSVQEVAGYRIETASDHVGHVEDLLLDDESWRVRYIVVDTRDWLPAKKVLLPLSGISEIEWTLQRVLVEPGSQEIKDAPAWDPDAPLDRDFEVRLHEHYGQAPYWVHE